MEIIKKVNDEDETKTVELVKDDKCLKMQLSKYDELEVSFSYENEKGYWFQEQFEIDKNDEEVYKAVDGIFLSYSGDVFFDTYGANLMLMNNEGKYCFFFMEDSAFASSEIKCKFHNDSLENNSMKLFFNRLQGLEEKKEQPKVLSKTLQKIVEK